MTQPIIFPDPISNLTQISGATLLYFDAPLIMGSPAVVIPEVAEQSYRLVTLIQERKPPWAPAIYSVIEHAREQSIGGLSVLNRLAGVREATLMPVCLVYPAGDEPFSAACEVAVQLAERLADAPHYITYGTAASDLQRHIFLEAFLEKGSDIGALYEYCEDLFTNNSLEHLLLSAYLLRLTAFQYVTTESGVLLANPQTAVLLAAAVPKGPTVRPTGVTDVVSWEIFRQVVSPRLDPLTDDRIALIREVRSERDTERVLLVDRCRDIASNLVNERGVMNAGELRRYVQTRVEPEISALLRLHSRALRDVVDELFSDKTTWAALAGLIAGLSNNTPLLSATSAVAALSSMGAAAYKTWRNKRSSIEASDLRLLYFIDRRA